MNARLDSPFHVGEQQVQRRMGVPGNIEQWARQVVRAFLPQQHQAFFSELPFVVVAARDDEGRPWTTLLANPAGVVSDVCADRLCLNRYPSESDALAGAIVDGADIGLLGIEFDTRRRNRVNGRVVASDDGFELRVDQSFGNCAQHIRGRRWVVNKYVRSETGARADSLSDAQACLIAGADTMFIATGFRGRGESEAYGMDASHRGGEAGFVQVINASTLLWPDFAGNNHYNTLGNLQMDSRVGLLFVDFARGSVLQVSGTAVVHWSGDAVAQRLVQVSVDQVVEQPGVLPLVWQEDQWETLAVVGRRVESAHTVSVWLAAKDGAPAPEFAAGQHLPIEVEIAGHRERRSYSISGSTANALRITVKREGHGRVSNWLHAAPLGSTVLAAKPAGKFVLRAGERPICLISTGSGVTPMVSMLRELVQAGDRRPVYFVHGATNGDHQALANDVDSLAAQADSVRVLRAFSRPQAGDTIERDFHRSGRVNVDWLSAALPTMDCDYYLCAQPGVVAGLCADLGDAGVSAGQVFAESFG